MEVPSDYLSDSPRTSGRGLLAGGEREALLVLADGTVFSGYGIGHTGSENVAVVGEVVFNTSMYGYQEILTDPSYAGQFITFTYPHIGNVGCNSIDFESRKAFAKGVIFRDRSIISSNFRSEYTFESFLKSQNLVGIYGIDTRALVVHLRDKGSQMGTIAVADGAGELPRVGVLQQMAKAQGSMEGKDYVPEVTTQEAYVWNEGTWNHSTNSYRTHSQEQLFSRPHVVAIDCGIKRNILRLLVDAGFRVTVVPATFTVERIRSFSPDALFLSNGPGDPATVTYVASTVRQLLGKIPIFGICLGHQILGIALGGKTYKLKFGHRGGNHPVKDLTTGKVEITVQNHGFAVNKDSLPDHVKVTHINLNDGTVEGIAVPDMGIFSVQYHPESSPGPLDSQYLFRRFYRWVVDPSARQIANVDY